MALDTLQKEENLKTSIQQEYKILAEYKMIESEKIGGVYVIPSFYNSLLWYGVIFVRHKFYKDAVFRFTILLPEKFPENKQTPAIIFQNEIFHPFICPFTGTLDISNAFPVWREGEDHIWQLLKYIQSIFLEPFECIKIADKVKYSNQKASDLMLQNRAEFIARAKECAIQSQKRIYDEAPTKDPHFIVFEKFDNQLHGQTLERIKLNKDKTGTPPTSLGLSWVKEGDFKPLSVD